MGALKTETLRRRAREHSVESLDAIFVGFTDRADRAEDEARWAINQGEDPDKVSAWRREARENRRAAKAARAAHDAAIRAERATSDRAYGTLYGFKAETS